MNDVVAIVVTYNRLDMLKKCIDSLKNQNAACDIMIINNGSTDDTELWIKNQDVIYFNTGSNLGGAGGFNYGMKKAYSLNYKYMWLMDDDCFPKEDALENLLKADKILDGNYGWLSSVALWNDGKECKMNRQKLKKSFYNYSQYLKDSIIQAEQATFVSLLVKSEIVKKVGLPISPFFIWGDDIEYTRRISIRYDIPSFVVGNSQVIHSMKENNGSSIAHDDVSRINRYKYAFRNEHYLYRKEGLKGIIYYHAKCWLNFFRILCHGKKHRFKRIHILLSSNLKGLFFNPKIEYLDKE